MKRIISLALCFLLIFTLCQPVFALSELEWTGSGGDGSWHNADNWDPAQVPEDGDYVIIPESSVVEYVYGETSVRLNCAGNLTVSGGTLKMTNPSLSENSSLTKGKLDGAGDITITNGSSFVWIGGNIEGTGRLIIEDNANLYASAPSSLDRYLVNNGSLLIDEDGSLRLTGGAEGSGNFNIQGGQTLELGGSGSYNLSSNLNNFGTLKILNTCASAQFNSGYTQQNTGTLEFDIGGPSDFTPLEVTGTALLNGILKINILDGYIPSPGDTFEIMTYGSRAGTFSSIESNIPEITFEPTYTDTGLILTVSSGEESGEYMCKVDDVGYDTLDGALEAVMYGGTIQLLRNIDYDGGIFISGADITFDLNGYTLNVNSSTYSVPGVGLEVKNGGNVFLIGSGQFNVRQVSDGTCYGVKVSEASTAMVTNVQVTLTDNGSAFGAYADGTGSSIHILGNVNVTGEGGCGARTLGRGRITIDGTITATAYINIGYTNKDKSSGVDDPEKPGYLKYCTEPVTGIVWVKVPTVTIPSAPQNFTATPGDGQVTLSWTAPASDGGAEITHYEVYSDDGGTWITADTNTSHTFTGLTNGTTYTFKVRAVNSVGNGAESSVSAIPIALEFAGGNGSEEEPYLIETVYQLNNVRNYLGTEHSDKHFKLNANLNLDVAPYNSDTGWQPIGTSASPFTGSFDGGGHTISGLFVNRSVSNYVGLFGYTGAGAEIRDLVLEDVDVTGCKYVGGLVGINNGEIIDVNGSGDVVGELDTGGLVGKNNGSISDSCFIGTVTGTDVNEYGDWTGGLVGYNQGVITNCWTDATVISEGDCIGGLVGENWSGKIRESFSSGTVTGYDYTGGLVGSNSDEITACYSTCTVNGDGDVGGLVGGNTGPISYSFAVGAVNGNSKIGGLVGSNTGGIDTGCYWDTETSGQSTSACGTGKSTANMKEQATFIGWDFDDVWGINGSDNNGYPFLRWQVYAAVPTAPTEPQNFTVTPGDGQVALSWTAPASDGGSAITKYQVSKDNGESWTDVELNTSYTFTGLTNGTTYTFKVRAVNSAGNGAEASATATPTAPAQTTHTVNFYSNGSLYTSKTVIGGSTLGSNWPNNPTRSGYSFGGWFTGQNGAGTQYTSTTIITADVDLYAKWTYNGGSGGGGGSSTPTTPASPVYKAIVKAGSGTEKTLLVRVNRDTGTASLGEDPWHERPQGRTVINMPSIPGIGIYSVGIPVPDLSTSDVQSTLTLNTGAGSITVPSNMLTGVADADGNKAQIAIGQGDKSTLPKDIKSAIGDRPLVQLTLSIDGKRIGWSNPNAPVTVSIPYTPTNAELANPENIVVWYIDSSGNIVTIPNGHYDPATGMVIFYTTHFSNYAVAYNKVSFNDVTADAWYHKAVSFIAARGITSGTGDGNFSPEAKLTRGQFIVMLMKAYGIAPDADPKDNFADAGATYYTGYLAAAKRLSISSGIGNNMFAPDKEITRQEMFTLLCNALKTMGRLPEGTAGKPLSAFADAGDIASWAKEAMTLLVETGTIGGYDGKLYPLSTSTRAEMAQVLYNLLLK